MFGGRNTASGIMYNETYSASLTGGAPYAFAAVSLAPLGFARVAERASHHCQLVKSLPAFGIATAGVLVFGGQTYSVRVCFAKFALLKFSSEV